MANNYVFPGQTQPASYPVGNSSNQDLQNFQAQAQNQAPQNQNGSADYVTREEFDKLKASFEELMK